MGPLLLQTLRVWKHDQKRADGEVLSKDLFMKVEEAVCLMKQVVSFSTLFEHDANMQAEQKNTPSLSLFLRPVLLNLLPTGADIPENVVRVTLLATLRAGWATGNSCTLKVFRGFLHIRGSAVIILVQVWGFLSSVRGSI